MTRHPKTEIEYDISSLLTTDQNSDSAEHAELQATSRQSIEGHLQPIINPDEVRQYKSALREVSNLQIPPLPSNHSLDSDGWVCVSTWRMSVYGTGDDRPKSGGSLILKDLEIWDNWLQWNSKSPVQMLSVALLENSVDYSSTAFAKSFSDWQKFQQVRIAIGSFERFRSVTDLVSEKMSASHFLWIYKNGKPMFSEIHRGTDADAESLSKTLEQLINSDQQHHATRYSNA